MIRMAAIKIGEKIYEGKRHADCKLQALRLDEELDSDGLDKAEEGFLTDGREFLNRVEAAVHVKDCGQAVKKDTYMWHEGRQLQSIDLW